MGDARSRTPGGSARASGGPRRDPRQLPPRSRETPSEGCSPSPRGGVPWCRIAPVKILICSFAGARLLEPTAYRHDQPFEGTVEDVMRVAGELYAAGLNVMLKRHSREDIDAILWVDDRGFSQR